MHDLYVSWAARFLLRPLPVTVEDVPLDLARPVGLLLVVSDEADGTASVVPGVRTGWAGHAPYLGVSPSAVLPLCGPLRQRPDACYGMAYDKAVRLVNGQQGCSVARMPSPTAPDDAVLPENADIGRRLVLWVELPGCRAHALKVRSVGTCCSPEHAADGVRDVLAPSALYVAGGVVVGRPVVSGVDGPHGGGLAPS